MKIKFHLFTIVLMFFLFACNLENEKKNPISEKEALIERVLKAKKDSVRLKNALQEALQFVRKNYTNLNYKHDFSLVSDSTTFDINTEIVAGNLFDNQNNHVLIKRKFIDRAYLNLYKKENKKLIEVMVYKNDHLNYISDTIVDVNGDGRKDFVLHQYPTSGCCLANIRRVFLNLEASFNREYEFLNPTFSPKQKIIRGIAYGQLGNTSLYKYQWNGIKIDTIENIYYNPRDESYSLIKPIKGISVLARLPEEYLDIKHIEWFLSD